MVSIVFIFEGGHKEYLIDLKRFYDWIYNINNRYLNINEIT